MIGRPDLDPRTADPTFGIDTAENSSGNLQCDHALKAANSSGPADPITSYIAQRVKQPTLDVVARPLREWCRFSRYAYRAGAEGALALHPDSRWFDVIAQPGEVAQDTCFDVANKGDR